METKPPRLQDSDEIDKKIEAITSVMNHWAWDSFVEIVQLIQGRESSKLFSQKFMDMEPVRKDKEHYAIVKVVNTLETILTLPNWLGKRHPRRWADVQQYIVGGKDG